MNESEVFEKASEHFLEEVRLGGLEFCNIRHCHPCFCWKSGGSLHHAVLENYSGMSSGYGPSSPPLLRLRVNQQPSPSWLATRILQSAPLRQQLAATQHPTYATSPRMDLTSEPEVLSAYGRWLVRWLEAWFDARTPAPEAPDLVVRQWDDAGFEKDVAWPGDDWRNTKDLWTRKARERFNTWFKQDFNKKVTHVRNRRRPQGDGTGR